jgi:SPP1 gp7 family putative phage head morphogenesis protein
MPANHTHMARRGLRFGPPAARRLAVRLYLDRGYHPKGKLRCSHVAKPRDGTFMNIDDIYKANEDIIKAIQWLATLDKRTCPSCASLDGKQFPPGSAPRPPLHIGCRCVLIPALNDEFAFLEAGSTRASKGAEGGQQVSAELNYYDWLKEQPASFQDEAIGPVRGKLLRDGGLSAEKFASLNVDKNYAPLTLQSMKEIDPIAFKKAGI